MISTTRALLTVLLGASALASPVLAAAPPVGSEADIVPRPAQEAALPGKGFALKTTSRIVVPAGDSAAAAAARYLQEKLAHTAARKLALVVGAPARDGDITLASDGTSPTVETGAFHPEAYRLKVAAGRIAITARGDAGLFYGAVSAWQLLTARPGATIAVPAMAIEDAPRFGWRGLMLDSARHIQSVAYIEQLLDAMAVHKLNRFHWHLSDDQGWRIEIPEYPRLTTVGAWRKAVGSDIGDAHTNAQGLYGGFYTQAQIRAIVAYAAARHITVVPEIDLPGHSTALLAAYPRLGVPEFKPEPVTADSGLMPEVVNVDDKTIATLSAILDKVMALFPGPYIHLGGDEADKTQWKGSPTVQARMKALGITDEDALERWLIGRLGQHLAARGRTLMGWEEIQNGGSASDLAKDTVIQTWHGGAGARKALEGGHPLLMAQAPMYYLDNRQENTAAEPVGWTDIITTQMLYRNDPIPAGATPQQAAQVIGVQGQLWTERLRKEAWDTRLLFPRAAAIAEVGWTPAARLDWGDFVQRMSAQTRRYAALGLSPIGPLTPGSDPVAPNRRTSLQLDFCEPDATGLVVERPSADKDTGADVREAGQPSLLKMMPRSACWVWHGADLTQARHVTLQVAHLPFTYRLGSADPIARFATPHTRDGEVELHLDRADGPLIASLPLAGFAKDADLHRLTATIPAQASGHDLYVVVTGQPIDSRLPLDQRRPYVALDWIAVDGG